jgi:preprotein translocase subunit SecY
MFYAQVNSSGVMPIIFSTSALAIPGALARFTGAEALKDVTVALYPGGVVSTSFLHFGAFFPPILMKDV